MGLEYSVQDRSLLLPHYKRLLVEPVLPAIPERLSPNAITHAGHLLSLAALALLMASADLDRGAPFFVVALLLNAYLWCDNADGSHARRTNQCSATGEFLDHGLDLLNASYVAIMTVVTLGAPPYWSVAAAVIIPAAAAVTYWEQAETGVFQLGMFNQIESIACLTIALAARALFGAAAIGAVHLGPVSLPVAILAFVTLVAAVGIVHSFVRVARRRGRLLPFAAPLAFGLAIALATKTGALGTHAAILAGSVVFVFVGVRQLTLRVQGARPLVERGVLVAAAFLVALASAPLVARGLEHATAGVLVLAFGGLALVHGARGHRLVARIDDPPPGC
ncbi:MAG: CDP-alcohol phosphatidyltransferase family protein [Labilithrix sp.]|nr:CDP-alcohol phosphatidyltransferase family protein [Labilithrix sp.]MCW5813424.1 CDP-alcohol phosphatidyltransferase family protein [Labilithrix sp.]